jgi:hypothetical protein
LGEKSLDLVMHVDSSVRRQVFGVEFLAGLTALHTYVRLYVRAKSVDSVHGWPPSNQFVNLLTHACDV